MKQIVLAILLAAGIAGASAAPVTKERAATTATEYATAFTGHDVSVKDVMTVKDAYYIVNLKPQGWVMVAADDNSDPILAISPEGAFSWYNIPDNARFVYDALGDGVKYQARVGKPLTHKWNNVVRECISRADNGDIDNLIKANWNQTSPFNKYCPKKDGVGQAIVGCVAVAMAQAMAVQKWPDRPTGKVTYGSANYGALSIDFDAEKPYNWDDMISGANRYDEAARFLYHAGMSVQMDYGPNASGVLTSRLGLIVKAMKENFSYGSDVRHVLISSISAKTEQEKYAQWERYIYNELSAGRAVVYNALSQGSTATHAGHSFNIDGYRAGQFHVNWGWGGDQNNYFNLNALNMTLGHDRYEYNYNQSIIIGIGSPNRVLRSIDINYTKIEENLPAGSVVGIITVNGETPKSDYKLSVRGAYSGTGFANVPFEIKGDRLVTTEPLSVAQKDVYNIEIVATAGDDRLTAGFDINVVKDLPVAQATSMEFNRESGEFTVYTKHGVTYTIYGADGNQITSGTLDPLPIFTFNRSILTKGKNRLVLRSSNGEKTLEIVN